MVTVGGRQVVQWDDRFSPGKLHALHSWTLTDVSSDHISLARLPESISVELPDPAPVDFFSFSEVCAGLGGTSYGAQKCGFRPLVAMDKSLLAVGFLRRNTYPKVIQGDMFQLCHLGLFHQAHDSRSGLLAGFPCQHLSAI